MQNFSHLNKRFSGLTEAFLYIYGETDLRHYPKLRMRMFKTLRANPEMLFDPLPIPTSSEFLNENLDFKVVDWLCARGDVFLTKVAIAHLKQQQKTITNIRDRFGNTPLTWAIISNTSADFVELLIRHGADPMLPNLAGTLPIHDVVLFCGQSYEVLRKLALLVGVCGVEVLFKQNDYGSTPASRAVFRGQIEIVQAICDQAALYGKDFREIFALPNKQGYTPYDLLSWKILKNGAKPLDAALNSFLVSNHCNIHGEVWKQQSIAERIAYDPTERGIYYASPNLNAVYLTMNGKLA
jgi:ankyrin repeat protein